MLSNLLVVDWFDATAKQLNYDLPAVTLDNIVVESHRQLVIEPKVDGNSLTRLFPRFGQFKHL